MIVPLEIGPAYLDRAQNEIQRCVNWYPEKTKEGYKLLSAPGLNLLGTVGNNSACRGAYYSSDGKLYSVNSTKLYRIETNNTATEIGTLSTGSGTVSMADNGTQLIIVDTQAGYIWNGTSLATISDANFPSNPQRVTFQDGFFITNSAATGRFYLSALNDGTDWTPSMSAVAEMKGDILICPISSQQQLYLLGQSSTEVWYNAGSASFPFARVAGVAYDVGTTAPFSIDALNGVVFFLGNGSGGRGGVWAVSQGGIRRVSTPSVEAVIGLLSPTLANGFCYEFEGHQFYELSYTSAGKTWVYDLKEDAWHERDSNESGYAHHRVKRILSGHSSDGQPPYAFDIYNGKFYRFANAYNSENGTDIRRVYYFAAVKAKGNNTFHRRIRIELEADHDSSTSYTLEMVLEKSDNGGLSFETLATLSKAITSGTTAQRALLEKWQLGMSKDRVYRITMTGPAARLVIKEASLEVTAGRF